MSDQPKRGAGRPGGTTPRQFRLTEETLAELDYLMTRLGLTSRADVIRHLSRRATLDERRKERGE